MQKVKNLTSGLAFRMICGILLLMMAFNWTISLIGYFQFTYSFKNEYNDAAFRTAETAATLIDGDRIETYLATGGDSDEYRQIWKRMDILCQKQGATLIYVIAVDQSDYGRFRSVFNTVNENSGYTPWEVGYERETTNGEYRQIYRDIYENGLERGTVARTSGLGGREPHITSLIPIKGSDGCVKSILCVERPMSELNAGRRSYLKNVAAATVLLTFLACVNMLLYLRRQFVTPVKCIMEEAKRFAAENTRAEQEALEGVTSVRELRELADAVDKMERDVLQYMDNLTRVTAEKERIGVELSLATRIQANMLPNIFPPFPDRDEFEIFASMTPAKEVGGDFYDFFLIDDDHLGIVMADVSGKGVPAALFMMMSKILVNNHAMLGGSPKAVLERVNNVICKKNENDMFVTIWFGILTISTGEVTAANAGHEYPAIRRCDGSFALMMDRHGLVIGGMEGVKYREYQFTLGHGETLFLYTDGVPEATNGQGKMFGTDRMLEALNRDPEADPQGVLKNVRAGVDAFVGEADQFDDLTMLAIKMK